MTHFAEVEDSIVRLTEQFALFVAYLCHMYV